MSDNYRSLNDITEEINTKRSELQTILQANHIFSWPREEEFSSFLTNEVRLNTTIKEKVKSIVQEILNLKSQRKNQFIKKS